MKKTVEVNAELRDYIEALNYEVESRKSLIAFALEKGLVENESFKKYHDEYKEAFIMYEEAKANLEQQFVVPLLKEDEKCEWNLNFKDCIITIDIKE